MVVAEGEHDRYLDACVDHLGEFCDLIVVQVDTASGGTYEVLVDKIKAGTQLLAYHDDRFSFFAHEGRARQNLLEMTLQYEPTHVLAIDADEFVADGPALRRALKYDDAAPAWALQMEEVWEASDDHMCVREDGGWHRHPVPVVWRVPASLDASYRIADRALACGRVPVAVDRVGGRAPVVGDLLHFGWTNEQERQARYDRYATHDGGRFHASAHLQSILAPCERVTLRPRAWPAGLDGYRDKILERANGMRT